MVRLFNLRKRENILVKGILGHLGKSRMTVERFYDFYEAIREHDLSRMNRIYGEIDLLEGEVDSSRRLLANELCSGSFFAYMQDDFLDFIEKIDSIADAAKDAAKVVLDAGVSEEVVKLIFRRDEMRRYIALCVETVKTLEEAFQTLANKGREALKLVEKVEELEETADTMKASLIKSLFNEAKKLKVLEVIQIKDFIYMVDNICDSAEDASDIILQIIAKGYG